MSEPTREAVIELLTTRRYLTGDQFADAVMALYAHAAEERAGLVAALWDATLDYHDAMHGAGTSIAECVSRSCIKRSALLATPDAIGPQEGESLDHLLVIEMNEREAGNPCGCRAGVEYYADRRRILIRPCIKVLAAPDATGGGNG